MATNRAYYDVPPARSANATVVRIMPRDDATISLVLDRTIFYPESGGQPCDLGTIAGFPVVSVVEKGDDVEHVLEATRAELDAADVSAGRTVRCDVNLERRLDHSEQHTAQHLLSAVLLRTHGAATLSFHLGERYSSIDLDVPPMDRFDADRVEDEVLRVMRDDYAVLTHHCPPEDPDSFPLRKEPSVDAEVLRVVEIDGLEYSACCGTHVRSTSELGAFRITKVEKYKGGSRVYYVAGSRAYADYRRLAAIVREAAATTGGTEDDVPGVVLAYQTRIKRLEDDLERASGNAAAATAALLASDTDDGAPVFAAADDFAEASRLARALAARGRVALVESRTGSKVAVASPAPADGIATIDSGAVFGPIARNGGGKGGGGKNFFQAAFPDAQALAAFVEAARLALR
ncbi:MAG: alanyl-tRNA editing protein [Spirochaetales bacterium]|nr:alanyl-tRNA editing protein [Spirochaetales bacterium]